MTEHEDPLSRRYRELAREEPPASLDATVLAAARQAVQPRARSRWMAPVAVAAVLVLGLGIALRMQVEQPGIETAAPASSGSAEYPIAPPAEEAPVAAERAAPAPQPAPAPKAAPKAPAPRERVVEEPPLTTAAAPPPAPAAAPATSASASGQEPAPMQSMAAPEPRAQPKLGIGTEGIAPQRAKRAELAAADSAAPARDAREVELERIARLRAEGRHAEADKALAEFRRRYPDYRIAEAMWERIRPR
jgi:hypothetical protein